MRKDILTVSLVVAAVLGAVAPGRASAEEAPTAASQAEAAAPSPQAAPAAAAPANAAAAIPAEGGAPAPGPSAAATPPANDSATAPASTPAPETTTAATPAAAAGAAPASPIKGTPALAVPPPRSPPRISWYAPTKREDSDAARGWNSSILGEFDPWTKDKVTVLFQFQSLELTLPKAKGMTEYDQPDGTKAKFEYPESHYTASYPGVRLEYGNWSIAAATANGKIRWGTDDLGNPFTLTAKTYEAIISRGFGAWAILDTASDVRLGISWPELYVRLAYGKFKPEDMVGGVTHVLAGAGVSILGIRLTVGDLLFAEVRAGDYSIHSALSVIDRGGDEDKDLLLQSVHGFELRPTFRVGLAL